MNKLLVIFTLLLFSSSLSAQKSFGHLIIGLESGFDVAQFSKGLRARASPAIQAEVSIGRLSLGVGVGRKLYSEYEFYSFTGETIMREVNGALQMFYLADLRAFKPAYWIFPVKINYRLHRCDCVYLHLGVTFDKVDFGRPDIIKFRGAQFNQPYAVGVVRSQLVEPRTKEYEIGIGFNVYRRDNFRLTARPAYVITENPEIYTDGPKRLPTLRFTFAVQYALWTERYED